MDAEMGPDCGSHGTTENPSGCNQSALGNPVSVDSALAGAEIHIIALLILTKVIADCNL